MDSGTCGATFSVGSSAPCSTTNSVPISSTQKLDGSSAIHIRTTHNASTVASSQRRSSADFNQSIETNSWVLLDAYESGTVNGKQTQRKKTWNSSIIRMATTRASRTKARS